MRSSKSSFPLHSLVLVGVVAFFSGCATYGEYGSETEFGLGVRGNVGVDRFISDEAGAGAGTLSRLELNGSVQRSWISQGRWTEANGDVLLPMIRVGGGAARTYVGTGLHLAQFDPDVGSTQSDVGLNLIGGLRFEQRTFAPFFEVRGSAFGVDQLSAVAGVQLFGGSF
jgi:hypothetical protein